MINFFLIINTHLFFKYLAKFKLKPTYNEEEFKHWFLPREGVIDSYVVEKDGVITDFGSFYHLPSTIMHNPQYNILRAAYSFYNVATKTPLVDLVNDLLISAKNVYIKIFIVMKYLFNI
jgi:glycylpeptide N-tetradecanoyltransferase